MEIIKVTGCFNGLKMNLTCIRLLSCMINWIYEMRNNGYNFP
jgi:hypothetical protein